MILFLSNLPTFLLHPLLDSLIIATLVHPEVVKPLYHVYQGSCHRGEINKLDFVTPVHLNEEMFEAQMHLTIRAAEYRLVLAVHLITSHAGGVRVEAILRRCPECVRPLLCVSGSEKRIPNKVSEPRSSKLMENLIEKTSDASTR